MQFHVSQGVANMETLGLEMTTTVEHLAAAVQAERPDLAASAATDQEGGRVVKSLGDGHMLAFPSASRARRAAIEIQRRSKRRTMVSPSG